MAAEFLVYYKSFKRIASIIIFTETYYALERDTSTKKVINQEPQPPAVSHPSKDLMRVSKTGLVQIQPLTIQTRGGQGSSSLVGDKERD